MIRRLLDYINDKKLNNVMVVSRGAFARYKVDAAFNDAGIEYTLFDGFNPNPDYEDIVNGVKLFRQNKCDSLIAIGGGSTIDVAKCIKCYAPMDPNVDYMEQKCEESNIVLIAVPTTAGSGSEVTPNAVIYRNKVKQSVAHPSLKPDYAVLDGSVLETISEYQKKCTVLDALCQAIEAWWSPKSTEESRGYSKQAVSMIMAGIDEYMKTTGPSEINRVIMEASNLAGRAIAIAGTTLPHAMSYRLTGLYGIAHGHGVALALGKVWRHILEHIDACTDARGCGHVDRIMDDIAATVLENEKVTEADRFEAVAVYERLLDDLGIEKPVRKDSASELDNLTSSVLESKCNSNPVLTTSEDVRRFYEMITV